MEWSNKKTKKQIKENQRTLFKMYCKLVESNSIIQVYQERSFEELKNFKELFDKFYLILDNDRKDRGVDFAQERFLRDCFNAESVYHLEALEIVRLLRLILGSLGVYELEEVKLDATG